jgi:hypothetical protein
MWVWQPSQGAGRARVLDGCLMAFTLITITGRFTREDGSPSQGTITAQLTEALHNETWLIDRVPTTGRLNDEGKLVNLAGEPFKLVATDDPATGPTEAAYQWTLEIDEAPARSFFAPLSHAAPELKVDISALEG